MPLTLSDAEQRLNDEGLTIVILGASGDLARKKTFPALFDLAHTRMLPSHIKIVGYARSAMDSKGLQELVRAGLKTPHAEELDSFLARLSYVRGSYDSDADGMKLNEHIAALEAAGAREVNNRMFYFALPPSVFVDMGRTVKATSMARTGWTRCVIEKPFGSDLESSNALSQKLSALFVEDQIYRIDHYLGKEMVLNLLVLRFANSLFTPLWNKECVEAVLIQFKEPIGTEGRAGYFDEFGIIRDIAQNHLCQIFALIAMDRPASLDPEAVRDAKVKVLQETLPIAGEECVVGQFSGWTEETPGRTVVQRGYLEEPGVPADSVTPTFAQVVLRVDNDRWRGTPFILKCGKGLNERKAEIRVQFKSPPGSLLFETSGVNELVIRVQPKEAIYLKMNCKTPGLSRKIVETELDMTFTSRFGGQRAPEAYERLISDCLLGDKSNFVRSDELAASWAIFTPLLHKLAKEKVKPVQYRFGGRGPEEADALAIKVGFRKSGGYKWSAPEEKFIGKM